MEKCPAAGPPTRGDLRDDLVDDAAGADSPLESNASVLRLHLRLREGV